MDEVVPGLSATAPVSPDFAPASSIRAFLVERPEGNVLLYASDRAQAADPAIERRGGIARVLLSHWHEAMFGAGAIGAPVHVAAADRAAAEEYAPIAGGLDPADAPAGMTFVPMPGHTPGSTAFLVDLGDRRALFTGDTLWFGPSGWKIAILPDSDRTAYRKSLVRLRALEFDLLIPSFASRGGAFTADLDRRRWHDGIDTLIARIDAGENF